MIDFFSNYMALYRDYNLLLQTLTTVSITAVTLVSVFFWCFLITRIQIVLILKFKKISGVIYKALGYLVMTVLSFWIISSPESNLTKYIFGFFLIGFIIPLFFVLSDVNKTIEKIIKAISASALSENAIISGIVRKAHLTISARIFKSVYFAAMTLIILFEYFAETGFGAGYLLRTVGGYWSNNLQVILLVHLQIIILIIYYLVSYLLTKITSHRQELL